MNTKICNKCNEEKLFSEFNKHKEGKFGLQPSCKKCIKSYNQINAIKLKNYNKKYWKNYNQKPEIKKERLKYYKEYYQKNKNKIRFVKNNYNKKRYRLDINFKLAISLRNRFNKALKNNQKYGSAVKMLGCSIEEFKIYFESLFTEGMNWEKVFDGSIHIDHKRPLASFDLNIPENQEKACHYTNLQPLWAVDNIKKGDKYVFEYKNV